MKKVLVTTIIISLMCICACNVKESTEKNKEDFILDEKPIEYYNEAINNIINYEANEYNMVIQNKYLFNQCIFVQVREENTQNEYMYKMYIDNDTIDNYVVYELYK